MSISCKTTGRLLSKIILNDPNIATMVLSLLHIHIIGGITPTEVQPNIPSCLAHDAERTVLWLTFQATLEYLAQVFNLHPAVGPVHGQVASRKANEQLKNLMKCGGVHKCSCLYVQPPVCMCIEIRVDGVQVWKLIWLICCFWFISNQSRPGVWIQCRIWY